MGQHLAHRRLAHVAYWRGEKARCRMMTVPICDLCQVKSGARKTSAVTLGAASHRTDTRLALATFHLHTFQTDKTIERLVLGRKPPKTPNS